MSTSSRARAPRRRRPARRTALAALALLLAASAAPAQDPPGTPSEEGPAPAGSPAAGAPVALPGETPADQGAPSFFATSLTLGAGRDSGQLVGDREIDDTVYVVTPSLLLLHRPSGRAELALAYEPEVETFESHPELDAVNHAAGALIRFDATRRSRLIAGGSLLDGEDPGRHLGGQLVDLPRSPFEQARVYAGWEHRWNLASVRLDASRTTTRIEPSVGFLGTGLDQTEDLGSLTFDRTLGPRTGLTFAYSYLSPEISTPPPVDLDGGGGEDPAGPGDEPPGDPRLEPISDPVQTGVVGLSFRPTAGLVFHLAGGALYERQEVSYIGTAEVLRQGDAGSVRLRYDRSLLSLGPAEAGADPAVPLPPTAALRDTVSDTVTLDFTVSPRSRRVRWEQLVWAARTQLPGDDEVLESLAASSRLVVRAARRLGVYAQYDFFDQSGSRLFGEPVSRSRYTAGLIVGISGPPEAWGIRTAAERPAGLLPHRRGE